MLRGTKAFFFRGTREQRSKNEGNKGTDSVFGNKEQRNSIFCFGGTGGQSDLFQGNKGTGNPSRRVSFIK